MIRQKVNIHGYFTSLKPEFELEACKMNPSDIGIVKAGPVLKWMETKQNWDKKFGDLRRRVEEKQENILKHGKKVYAGEENPPLTALVRRIRV